jgi:hypothetical protein
MIMLLKAKHSSVNAYRFYLCSWEFNILALISLIFHKMIEIKAIFFQVFLHIIQGSFVRVRSSEHDVNACCKKETR